MSTRSTLAAIAVVLLLPIPPAAAEPRAAVDGPGSVAGFTQPLQLASVTDAGVKGNGGSLEPSLSSSGTRVAFFTHATNLDPADTDADVADVYRKNQTTGELVLASTSDAGVKGNDDSTNPMISANGLSVAFGSNATNLDPADTDSTYDIYVKHLDTGDLVLASTSSAGVKGNGCSCGFGLGLSGDGNRVAFATGSTNLDPADTDTDFDVYVKKLRSENLVLASTSSAGVKGNDSSNNTALSNSGTRVAFDSDATNLDPGDTDTKADVYVKDLPTGVLTLASATAAGVKGNGNSETPALSGNGNRVAFASLALNLSPLDPDATKDIYVKNVVTGELKLVSTSDTGVKGNGDSFAPRISGDGKRVVFTSMATNLDPADTDPGIDVYVKDLATGDISLVSASAAGTKGDGRSFWSAISGEGRHVAFQSESTNLDPVDADPVTDVYVKDPLMCTIAGTSGSEQIQGTDGDDVICGRGDVDVLIGWGGNDVLLGEDGDDFLEGGAGADLLDGGAGSDSLEYSLSPSGVTVDLSAGTASGGDADGDGYLNMEGILGSAFTDALVGDAGINVLNGLDGDDVLTGRFGADTLDGWTGADILSYAQSPSAVVVNLQSGFVSGGDAAGDLIANLENVTGSPFPDTLTGTPASNTLSGLNGGDTLNGLGADDILVGGAGTDTFDGGGGTDTCDNVAGETATQCEL
jgi:Tol biopolymer transport system component